MEYTQGTFIMYTAAPTSGAVVGNERRCNYTTITSLHGTERDNFTLYLYLVQDRMKLGYMLMLACVRACVRARVCVCVCEVKSV